MSEVKDTLKRLAVYLLLLLFVMLATSELIPNIYPVRHLSSIVLLLLSICLFQYYRSRVARTGAVKNLMLWMAALLCLLLLLRAIKYTVFTDVAALKRFTWYLYYAPLLLLPQSFFFLSLCIHAHDTKKVLRKWAWTGLITCAWILLVLTNDVHQLVFRFLPNFENWDHEYHHGVAFYLMTIWQYAFYLISVIILLYKCRRSVARKHAYLILLPFLFGAIAMGLLFLNQMPKIHGVNILEFPEINGFMVAGMLECCMSLGLIPTNEHYRELMAASSVAAQITDETGMTVYRSSYAIELPKEAFSGTGMLSLNDHTILRKKVIPGGFGFWQEDIGELKQIDKALAEAKEKLSEEGELIALQNELKEEEKKIEQRILIYDEIARRTVATSQKISALADQGLKTEDALQKDQIKKHITLLGVYIKRYANLMILGQGDAQLNIEELRLALTESLHYLNYYGIPCEMESTGTGEISAEIALAAFHFYEMVLEESLPTLKAVFINLSDAKEGFQLKMNFEGCDIICDKEREKALADCSIKFSKQYEDDISYLTIVLPKGGDKK